MLTILWAPFLLLAGAILALTRVASTTIGERQKLKGKS
jgi:hypothetical protein